MKLTTKLTDLDHAEVAREFNLDTDLVNDVASGVYTVDVLWDAVAAEVAARLARKCGPASWNGDGLMRWTGQLMSGANGPGIWGTL